MEHCMFWLPVLLGVVLLSRWGLQSLLRLGTGLCCLVIFNAAAPITGLTLPISPVSVGLSAFFGLPGLVLTALYTFL